jgi:hypothetical protein
MLKKKEYTTSELRKGNPAQGRKPNKVFKFVTRFSSACRVGQGRKQDVVVGGLGKASKIK